MNAADSTIATKREISSSPEPGVNAGPNTAAGKGRERPWRQWFRAFPAPEAEAVH